MSISDEPVRAPSPVDLDFDPDMLRRKYREERDRRLREDGNDQYVAVEGEFKHYIDDPYLEEELKREPLRDDVEVLVIGGGFGGLLAGAKLRDAGVEDIRMIEKGGDFGGTWYWNRYPGAACDIEAYVYLPLLEEIGYMPPKKFIEGRHILEYSQRIARHYDLYRDVLFQTEVTDLRWDEARTRWIIKTNKGDEMTAKFVVMSNGPLNRPKLPGIPGINEFKGHTFHTSRWDYEYTGGSAEGGLDRLGDKVVGIIGTGATAVQCVPHLAEGAKHLYVFQRTPSSIDERRDRPTDPDWFQSQEPGWHQKRMENFNTLVSGGFAEEDLVKDGWTEIIRNLVHMIRQEENADLSPGAVSAKMELADFQKMEQIRARVDALVEDPSTAEALKPYYRQFCKRPCFHDDYLPAFNRDNVTLVDTKGQGVDRLTPDGVVVDGQEYKLDCLVFSTGFEVGTSYSHRCGYEIYGRDGITLDKKFADGVKTFHGLHSRGFPNCFIMGSNFQSGFTANYPHALSEQSIHIAYIIKHCIDGNQSVVEASEEAEEAWVQEIIDSAQDRVKFLEECTPGYYNNEGKPRDIALQNSNYGKGSDAFFKILKDWREEGVLKGLELS